MPGRGRGREGEERRGGLCDGVLIGGGRVSKDKGEREGGEGGGGRERGGGGGERGRGGRGGVKRWVGGWVRVG